MVDIKKVAIKTGPRISVRKSVFYATLFSVTEEKTARELVKKLNKHDEYLSKISEVEKQKKESLGEIKAYEKNIESALTQRRALIEGLASNIEEADQSGLDGIKFGLEYGFDKNLQKVTKKINVRESSEFIDNGSLEIKIVLEKPGDFLRALFSGQQKIISGHDNKDVAIETLTLTEKILFTAEMESDKIGGFSESTMTPGKRALFALRLILAETDETWPLLIDQPEDDLDSRSIYHDVVPFLKEKKKERQIIMVSHNANLVVNSDTEQIIVANRHGGDRINADGKSFNYLTGCIEHTKEKDDDCEDTLRSQGVREHSCDILDGGRAAFEQRGNKYNLIKT